MFDGGYGVRGDEWDAQDHGSDFYVLPSEISLHACDPECVVLRLGYGAGKWVSHAGTDSARAVTWRDMEKRVIGGCTLPNAETRRVLMAGGWCDA